MVLAVAAKTDWEVIHLGVATAFLYVGIEESMFVEIALNLETANKEGNQQVMKLRGPFAG